MLSTNMSFYKKCRAMKILVHSLPTKMLNETLFVARSIGTLYSPIVGVRAAVVYRW